MKDNKINQRDKCYGHVTLASAYLEICLNINIVWFSFVLDDAEMFSISFVAANLLIFIVYIFMQVIVCVNYIKVIC